MGKYKSTIMGETVRIKYYVDYHLQWSLGLRKPEIAEYKEHIRDKIFYQCEIEKPFLELGELLYIDKLDLTVEIKKRAKSTEEGYVYWTDHIVEKIEDDITQETKKKAEEEFETEHRKYMNELTLKQIEDEVQQRVKQLKNDSIKRRKWYRFWD